MLCSLRQPWAAPCTVVLSGVALFAGTLVASADSAVDDAAPTPPAAISSASTDGASSEASASTAALRLREGTQFTDHLGHFRQQGESVVFVDNLGRELGGLPNLNLERILRMLKGVDEPESVAWSVSGTVTEFGGRNYLLITRAIFKSATLPPAPDLVE
jgi:hypothetical protein